MPSPAPTSDGQPEITSPRRFWDQLRRVRANTQGLQTSLAEIDKSGDRFDEALAREQALWNRNATDVDEGLKRAQSAVEAGAAGDDDIADEIDLVLNDWDRTKEYWGRFVQAPPAASVDRHNRVAEIETLLKAMVLRVGYLTVPIRVADYLNRQRIGGVFDFHEAFKDELPLLEDRIAVLRYLKGSPEGIYGLIDIDSGLIWRISPDAWKRRRSYLIAGLILLAGLAGVAGAAAVGVGGPFVATRRDELSIAYVAVGVGVLVHIAVDLYKQSRSIAAKSSWTAVDDLVLWGHAHQAQMFVTAFSVWAGAIALAILFGRIEPITAFIAGYSLDSFLDAALGRFSSAMETGTAALKKQVEVVH